MNNELKNEAIAFYSFFGSVANPRSPAKSKNIINSALLALLFISLCHFPSHAQEKEQQILRLEAGVGKGRRSFEFTYTAKITKPETDVKKVSLWFPVPQASTYQEISALQFNPKPQRISKDAANGNTYAYWEFKASNMDTTEVTMTFNATRKEIAAPQTDNARALTPGEKKALRPFLQASRLVLVGKPIQKVADQAAGKATTSSAISRSSYDYVYTHMKYSKHGTGWGQGSTQWACDSQYGNCTDFHALFLSLTRTKGIPAKFEMGFPLAPKQDNEKSDNPKAINGYHCWAKFYIGQVGWLPVDISEAFKHKDLADYYYGNLTPDRIHFTTGRDLNLIPKQAGPALNYFIYPHAEADGKTLTIGKAFSFKDTPKHRSRN